MCLIKKQEWQLTEKCRLDAIVGSGNKFIKPHKIRNHQCLLDQVVKRDFLNAGGKTAGIETTSWVWPQNYETLFQLTY